MDITITRELADDLVYSLYLQSPILERKIEDYFISRIADFEYSNDIEMLHLIQNLSNEQLEVLMIKLTRHH